MTNSDLPSNRKFGLFFTVIFAGTAVYSAGKGSVAIGYSCAGVAACLLLAALVKPDILLPLNKLWMRFGLLLAAIVNPVVMGVIFFGIFTPVSLLMRLIGRDELCLQLRDRPTYWKERSSQTDRANPFKDQF